MNIRTYQEQSSKAWVATFDHTIPKMDSVDQIRSWCYNTYGVPQPLSLGGRWRDNIWWGEARFRSEEDLLLFVMRWS